MLSRIISLLWKYISSNIPFSQRKAIPEWIKRRVVSCATEYPIFEFRTKECAVERVYCHAVFKIFTSPVFSCMHPWFRLWDTLCNGHTIAWHFDETAKTGRTTIEWNLIARFACMHIVIMHPPRNIASLLPRIINEFMSRVITLPFFSFFFFFRIKLSMRYYFSSVRFQIDIENILKEMVLVISTFYILFYFLKYIYIYEE